MIVNRYILPALLAVSLGLAKPVLAASSDTTRRDLNIVFIGNSITHGAGLKNWQTEAPPNETCAWLRQQPRVGRVEFSNQGVSGHTTVDFLPATAKDFTHVEAAANAFTNKTALLVFSIILGTNDSAIKGPNGAPVSKEDYQTNLQTIVGQLLKDFPNCRIVLEHPTWYSPNTHNRGAAYMQEGLTRLQTYFPKIKATVKSFAKTNPKQVFLGDTDAFGFFQKHAEQYLQHENSVDGGIFYLHPNKEGAVILGDFWAKAIYKNVIK